MELRVCGCGHDGRLGLGKDTNVHSLTAHPFFTAERAPVRIFCGGFHSFVLAADGVVYAFGLNEQGQLGLSSKQPAYSRPTPVPFFQDMDLSLLGDASVDVVWLAGAHNGTHSHRLSDVELEHRERILSTIANMGTGGRKSEVVLGIECGGYHTMVLTNKALYACGANDKGQLGVGHFDNEKSFVTVTLPVEDVIGHVVGVSCGPYHSGIIIRDGSLPTRLLQHPGVLSTTSPDLPSDVILMPEEEDMTVVPFSIMCCGAGDFGELGRDADEWEKLHAMEARVKNHVSLRSHHEQQGGSNSDIAEFTPTTMKSAPKFKIKGVVPIKRREAFSSESFKRVRFPFLDEYALEMDLPTISYIDLRCSLRHTSVTIHFDRSAVHAPKSFHWGCYYCDKVETDASSIPREVPTNESDQSIVRVHGGEEVLITVHRQEATRGGGDTIVVQGKGNLGCGDDDDFSEEGKVLVVPVDGPFEVLDVQGKDHYLMSLRLLSDTTPEPYVVAAFGSNFMGNLGVGNDDEVGETVHIISRSSQTLYIGTGFRHSMILSSKAVDTTATTTM